MSVQKNKGAAPCPSDSPKASLGFTLGYALKIVQARAMKLASMAKRSQSYVKASPPGLLTVRIKQQETN